jgi:hypothetical protein
VPTDQRLEGAHGLTFRTRAAEQPLDLTGPSALHLVASSTASDTDWYAKLSDVAPDGSESIIEEGALRASHRALDPARSRPERPFHTHVEPQPIEPERFYEYDVEIWPTAYRIAAGHRLQLRLTSVDVPTHLPGSIFFDRGRPQDARIDLLSPAINTVRFDGSYLVLPVAGEAAGQGGGADGPAACPARTRSRRVAVRRGRATVIVARLTDRRRHVRGATVRVRGPGFDRRAKTNARGAVRLRLRARRSGRATVSTRYCGGRLRVSVKRAGRPAAPSFTG